MVPDAVPLGGAQVRAAELIAALSLATDLGIGVPLEHGLHSTLIAMRLGERMGVDAETASQAYYACLLFYIGCTANSDLTAEIFGDENVLTTYALPARFGSRVEMMAGFMRALAPPGHAPLVRARELAFGVPKLALLFRGQVAALCEVAQMLTDRLGLPAAVGALFAYVAERWDGKGEPGRAKRDEIPLAGADRASGSRRRVSANAGRRGVRRTDRPRAGGRRVRSRYRRAACGRGYGDPGARYRDFGVGGDARLRAASSVDPAGRGDRCGAGGDGRFRRPCLSVPGRSLGRSGRAGDGGCSPLRFWSHRPGHDSPGSAGT